MAASLDVMPNEVLKAIFCQYSAKDLVNATWHPLTSLVLPLVFYSIPSPLTLAVGVVYFSLKSLLPPNRRAVFVI